MAASFDDAPPTPPCEGVELLHVPLRRRVPQRIPGLNDMLHGNALGRALREASFSAPVDLVDVQEANIARGVYRAARHLGWVIVHSVHLSALYGTPRFGSVRQRILASMNVWAASQADHSIAVSRCVKEAYLASGIPEDRISVVYNPVSLDTPPASRLEDRQRKPIVLWISRMVEGKGVEEAVAVAESLCDKVVGARFVFVGGGSHENLVRAAAQRHDRIRWTGVVRDRAELDRLRADADVFLATSLHETFGMAVAEAMAAGLPVVATDIAAHREVLGDAGIFYAVGDPYAASAGLAALCNSSDRRNAMGAASRSRAESIFSPQRASDGLLSAYSRAMQAADRSGSKR